MLEATARRLAALSDATRADTRRGWLRQTLTPYAAGGTVSPPFRPIAAYLAGGEVPPRLLANACWQFGVPRLWLEGARERGEPDAGSLLARQILGAL